MVVNAEVLKNLVKILLLAVRDSRLSLGICQRIGTEVENSFAEVNLVLPMQTNTSIIDINGRKTHALIDTGAEITCCSFDFYSKLALSDKLSQSDIPSIKGTTSTGLDRTYYPVTISPFGVMNVGVKISKRNSGEIVLLEPVSNLVDSNLTSAKCLVKINKKRAVIRLMNPTNQEIHIPATKVVASVSDIDLNFIHDLDNEPSVASLQQTNQVKEPIEFDFSSSDLNSEQRQKMQTFLSSYRDIFANNLSELGFTNRYKHRIETFRDARPVKMGFYNHSPHMHKETEKKIGRNEEKQHYQRINQKGCNNQVADALSRRSYPEQPDNENELAAVKVSNVNTGTEAIGKYRTSESIQVEFFYDDYTMIAPLDPVIARPELSNLPAIANLQQGCPDFGNMYRFLTQGILPADNDQSSKVQKSAQDYSICNNVLYKWFQKRVRIDNGEKLIKQLCLPQALREDALLSYHDSFVGGAHLWIERVYHALSL
ncbi:unnamed protein product [Mytilus coruscus]|uniref:Peptidase A2 domain-containing protein n=1 Tax=Mytilus coruscus TaxID=42192 RepID=A0A6J8C9R5_MYTCO|nr:unnamed protein product [Mytilus coruscus]